MRDEIVEAGPKCDRGHQHDHGEHGTQDGGTDRCRVSAPPGIEGEAQAGHCRYREPRGRSGAHPARLTLPRL